MSRPDVAALFDRIAPMYDAMNERISYGRQRVWKRAMAKEAARNGGDALDLCCGTGDICLLLAETERFVSVTGMDFSRGMLDIAKARCQGKPVTLLEADANAGLPFLDGRFDTVTVSFGLRNLENPAAALLEMRRVLKEGGRLYVLDACRPAGPLARLAYGIQYRLVFPVLTRKNRCDYDWLRRSSEGFWSPAELSAAARKAGLVPLRAKTLAMGLAIYQIFERADA